MNSRIIVREIEASEISNLDNFLYDAIFVSDEIERRDKSIIKIPELARYIAGFGKDSDLCLVAELQGELIGAIWIRIFKDNERGYGYLDSTTPELSMSVKSNHRQQGLGTYLLLTMIDRLIHLKYEQVSLSVDNLNYACKFYQNMGFEVVNTDGKSTKMRKRLTI
jgi:ribosomal protein S18 acetylase RimI-like enzyme